MMASEASEKITFQAATMELKTKSSQIDQIQQSNEENSLIIHGSNDEIEDQIQPKDQIQSTRQTTSMGATVKLTTKSNQKDQIQQSTRQNNSSSSLATTMKLKTTVKLKTKSSRETRIQQST
jgi:hypothetical protein